MVQYKLLRYDLSSTIRHNVPSWVMKLSNLQFVHVSHMGNKTFLATHGTQ